MSTIKPIDNELNPCRNLCQPNELICKGCGRDESQRLNWGLYSDNKKRETMRKIRIKPKL